MDTQGRVEESEKKTLPKPNNIVTVPVTLDTDFFSWWCVFLRPFISLTNKEVQVIACLLKHRWQLSKCISDPVILDSVLMKGTTKKQIIEECDITLQHYHVILTSLRKHNVIIDNMINPRIIPNIRQDDNGYFQLLVLFKDIPKK